MSRPEQNGPGLRVAVPTLEPDDLLLTRLATSAARSAVQHPPARLAPVGAGWRAALAAVSVVAVVSGGAWLANALSTDPPRPTAPPVTQPAAPEKPDDRPGHQRPEDDEPTVEDGSPAVPDQDVDDSATADDAQDPEPGSPAGQQESEGDDPAPDDPAEGQPDGEDDGQPGEDGQDEQPGGEGQEDQSGDDGDDQPDPEDGDTEQPDQEDTSGEDGGEQPDDDGSDPDDATDDGND